jgi:hypothetical protein
LPTYPYASPKTGIELAPRLELEWDFPLKRMYMSDVLKEFFKWLEQCDFAVAIAESAWAFPIIEIIHVFSVCLVVGSIAIIDLRLLGIASVTYSIRDLTGKVLPWTWTAFGTAACAGSLMFSSKASQYAVNPAFRLKMLFLALAGMNMLTFHLITARTIANWDHGKAPTPARVAGALSLILWITVVACGRWTGFVDN